MVTGGPRTLPSHNLKLSAQTESDFWLCLEIFLGPPALGSASTATEITGASPLNKKGPQYYPFA